MKKFIITLICILIVTFVSWFFSQETIEGYRIKTGDSEIWVIESTLSDKKPEIEGKTQAEIDEIYNLQGTYFHIPAINKIANTDFKLGQKIRIYWDGRVYTSAPGIVDDTVLIVKIKE